MAEGVAEELNAALIVAGETIPKGDAALIAAGDADLIVAEGVAEELNAALIMAGETFAARDAALIAAGDADLIVA